MNKTNIKQNKITHNIKLNTTNRYNIHKNNRQWKLDAANQKIHIDDKITNNNNKQTNQYNKTQTQPNKTHTQNQINTKTKPRKHQTQ